MGEQGKPNGLLAERQIWQLEAQLTRLQGLFDWYRQGIDKDLVRLENGIKVNADEIDDLKKSINSAIRWLAIGAAGIVFELLRKGVTF
jgi:hypothetical protein